MSDWMHEYAQQRALDMQRGGDIEVECDECEKRWYVWDDPAGAGAGYPYGWQFIVHGCGGVATPVRSNDG